MNQTEYKRLPYNTSITELKKLCGWGRDPKETDWKLVGVDSRGNYTLSRVIPKQTREGA